MGSRKTDRNERMKEDRSSDTFSGNGERGFSSRGECEVIIHCPAAPPAHGEARKLYHLGG
jgi:hypothetical protein